MSSHFDTRKLVVVVGAGASGLVATIAAAGSGANVTLLEADSKPARKLLRTGNGRCNLTNTAIRDGSTIEEATGLPGWHGAQLAEMVCSGRGHKEIRSFFHDLGLMTYEDSQGRVYPMTNKARSVVDVLVGACCDLGVKPICECKAESVRRMEDGRWLVVCDDDRVFSADAVVLACAGTEPALELGIESCAYRPVLGPLRTQRQTVRQMDGIRTRCELSVMRPDNTCSYRMEGEILFRKYGISGIVVFDASRVARPGDTAVVDMLPSIAKDELIVEIRDRLQRVSETGSSFAPPMIRALDGLLLRDVTRAVLPLCGLNEGTKVSEADPAAIAHVLKHLELEITGGPEPDEAQVMRGGIEIGSVDGETMGVRGLDGLYVCGEAVDVDGPCGGFNLHWAWVSGALAGASAAGATLKGIQIIRDTGGVDA